MANHTRPFIGINTDYVAASKHSAAYFRLGKRGFRARLLSREKLGNPVLRSLLCSRGCSN